MYFLHLLDSDFCFELNWKLATNSNFINLISLLPDVVDIGYFRLWFFSDKVSKLEISKVYTKYQVTNIWGFLSFNFSKSPFCKRVNL